MRIVLAPDSFKESLTALEVAHALAEGWRRARPLDEILCVPMSDGGEGTASAMVAALEGQWEKVTVTGPLGEPVDAAYGLLEGGRKAVIEMAAASGLTLVPPTRRNPAVTTTLGTGELIRHALGRGVREIVTAIGGSATNDGGAGMAQALGYRLLDAQGAELPPGGLALERLDRIDAAGKHPALERCRIRVACDVDNPLCGPSGAARVYGPQKGASPELVARLDTALARFAKIIERDVGVSIIDRPGSGAAGGLGGGLVAFAGGVLEPGAALVAEACGLAERMSGADLVITGEGRMDGQTVHGKTPMGVATLAQAQGIPVIAVTGSLGLGFDRVYAAGISAIFPIAPGPGSIQDAIENAERYLVQSGETLARLWSATRSRYTGK